MIGLDISKTKPWVTIAGFLFYLYELYSYFHTPITGYIYDGSPEIFFLRMVILLVAFPILYLFRFSYLLGLGEAFSWFLASLTAKEGEPVISAGESVTYVAVGLIINFLLAILIFFRLVNLMYKLF